MLLRQSWAAANLLLLAILFNIFAVQEAHPRQPPAASSGRSSAPTGLILNRLSAKDLERWKAIERVVFLEDADQQPFHPTLRRLWEWVETSGHSVFIEINRSARTTTCTAGSFTIEHFDPKGERHVALIRLNLASIDQAYIGRHAARANGFIPFQGLSREERYAEVLGHELAHAVHILTNLERAKTVEMMIEKTNETLLAHRPRRKDGSIPPELKRKITQRDALLRELEKQAEHVEYVVWREMAARKSIRGRLSLSAANR